MNTKVSKKKNDKQKNELSKYCRFDVEVINRDQIKNADYNPRVISDGARKRLRKAIQEHGLVETLVWNKRTGNLVSGHQRIQAIDTLDNSQNYSLRVSVIEVDDRTEKKLNVQLNNPSMQGEWDLDALASMSLDDDIDLHEMGFTDHDIDFMFDGDSRFSEVFGDTAEVEDAKSTLDEIKKHRQESTEKMQEDQSADFYFTVVCESQEDKEKLMKEMNTPKHEVFITADKIWRHINA